MRTIQLQHWNITVTVSVPPETDTPGYLEQNKDNPIETDLISKAAGLFKVGRQFI